MNWETILCLGDSITIGSRSYMGYPEYCGSILSKRTNKFWNVINHATAGFTTIDLCRSVSNNVANLKVFNPEIVTIMIGTNDLKRNTTASEFEIAYQQLLIKAKIINQNSNITLIEIPDLKEGVMLPYTLLMNNNVRIYNEIIRELATKMGARSIFISTELDDFFDGVHLNESGSKKWGMKLANMLVSERFLTENNEQQNILFKT